MEGPTSFHDDRGCRRAGVKGYERWKPHFVWGFSRPTDIGKGGSTSGARERRRWRDDDVGPIGRICFYVRRQPGGTQLGLLPKQGYSWRSTNNTGEGSTQLPRLVGTYLESWAHSSGLETILN